MEAKKFVPYYKVSDWENWEGDWELIEGIAFAMSPSPVFKHQKTSRKITVLLDSQLIDCPFCELIYEFDWMISPDTIVRPDLMVVCGDKSDMEKLKRLASRPELIVEVLSESTERKDRDIKLALYEHEGVPTVILVDPENKVIEVYEIKTGVYSLLYKGEGETLPHQIKDCMLTPDWGMIWK